MKTIAAVLFILFIVVGAVGWFYSRGGNAPLARLPAPQTSSPSPTEFVFAVFYSQDPEGDLLALSRAALNQQNGNFKWVEAKRNDEVGVLIADSSTSQYSPPAAHSLKYFGRGITVPEVEALQHSKRVLVLRFVCKSPNDFGYLLSAERLAHRIASDTGGFIWDESSRLLYARDFFQQNVLNSWDNSLPSLRREISIHIYQDGNLMRAVSLGMEKFGLPNLVINQVSRSAANSATTLMTVCGQKMVEDWPVLPGTTVDVDLGPIRQKDVKTWAVATLLEGATQKATVQLAPGKKDDGDAPGPLLEFTFAGEDGKTPQERQESLLGRFFGKHDEMVRIKHDEALLELSRQARDKLKMLKAHFQEGLKPGERLLVKGPFCAENQTEWMWVDVTQWKGDTLSGTLQNDPVVVVSLKSGSPVNVNVDEAFDYLYIHDDGSKEGNETGKAIQPSPGK